MLPALYLRLGTAATFTHAAGLAVPVRVVFDVAGATGLGGMQQLVDPTVRVQTSEVPAGVSRGDLFVIDGITWQAREGGLPLLDGAELQVPLGRA